MYANTDALQLGEDHFRLKDGKYMFTYVFDGHDRVGDESVPETVTKKYGTSEYVNDVYAYVKDVKDTEFLLDEDDVQNMCYHDVIVPRSRLEELEKAKVAIQQIIDQCSLTEPFVFEDGKLSVGKEHVLSAHINSGYENGWLHSSICW